MTERTAPLRVAHVAWGYLGGGVDSVLDSYLQADHMHPKRVISHVVVVRRPGAAEQKVPKAEGGYSLVSRRARELSLAARDTAEHLRDFAPNIVLLHGFNATILGFALRHHLPVDLPIVCSYHGRYYARSIMARAKATLFNKLELRFFCKHANAVIAVSHDSAAQLKSGEVPAEKIIVLHNAVAKRVPPWPQRVHNDADGSHDAVKLISVSRLAPEKGIDVLLRAFAKLAADYPETALDIVGDGPLRGELEVLARDLAVSGRVRFLGNRRDVPDLLGEADVFAMTSRQENHSVSILEAMRAGLPSIVTDVGGNRESIRDGVEGYLVPDLDVRAAAAAMARLVVSSELRARSGGAARARYEAEFESSIMIDRFIAVLAPLAGTPEGAHNG